jgi:hypothetical protein
MRKSLKSCWLLVGLAVGPTSAFAQAVTLADLEGAVVEARVVNDQQIRREGREFGVQFIQAIRIVFNPSGTIDWSLSPTSITPRGPKRGPTRTGTAELGKPGEAPALGGGDSIWLFEDGALVTLRTYTKAGGYKRTIAFERKGGAITCTAKEIFMREEGAGPPSLRSAIDNVPVLVLSYKPAASTCKVTLKKAAS